MKSPYFTGQFMIKLINYSHEFDIFRCSHMMTRHLYMLTINEWLIW